MSESQRIESSEISSKFSTSLVIENILKTYDLTDSERESLKKELAAEINKM